MIPLLRRFGLVVAALALAGFSFARAADAPRTIALRSEGLVAARAALARGDARLTAPLAQLRAEADPLLTRTPASVLDKTRTAASGDKHDYFSFAPYWWPDPKQPDGLPYIRDDGKVNPDSKRGTDSAALARTCGSVETLGLAYFFTDDERYAQKAATLTRVWFLDAATRMNPHLEYAQAIPGINVGRGIGIIETRHLIGLIDGLALLAGSPAWSKPDADAMTTWLEAYYQWLTTSKNGRDEAAAENNHGSWYDVQTVALALAVGRVDDARNLLAAVPAKRIARQIEPDGRQPLELARTKSLDYSCFNLEALVRLARLGEHVGVDLWTFSTADGRNLRTALRYVAPYADPAKTWPKEDIKATDRARLLPLLDEAQRHEDDADFRALFTKFGGTPAPGQYWRLAARASRR
ncbi:MAG: alginate lyase family protein [Opitutaceae bacterium]